MSNAVGPSNIPPGWYADPSDATQTRWWDGVAWSQHTSPAAPSYAATAPTADRTISPYNKWIWLALVATALPVLGFLTFDFRGWMSSVMAAATSAAASGGAPNTVVMQAEFTPAYFAFLAVSWLSGAAMVVFCWLDWRALKAAGVVRPFHWAFAFLNGYGVYYIGRSVVANRRTGRGWAPMWIWIAFFVLSIIVSIVLVVSVMSEVFGNLTVPNV